MRHQIFKLRDYISNGVTKKAAKYIEGCDFEDLKDLFKNPQTYIAGIAPEERFNIYFTEALCAGEREFRLQKYIPFDIDHIDVLRAKETVQIALGALGLNFENTLSVFSGNGVQFHIELAEPFEDPNFFDIERVQYKACADRINRALKEAQVPGSCDSSVWSTGRLMRMPATLNKKPDKQPRMAEVLNDNSVATKFSLSEASGLPRIEREEMLAKWPPPDTNAVLEGCGNLRAMRESPDSIPEPLWYACASVVGNLGGNAVEGRRIWHVLSSKYSGYVAAEADRKLDQALAASGPRTCQNFSTLDGNKCSECVHFRKLKSPILIISKDYIKTKETGFHSMVPDANGRLVLGRPQYEDLRKYFEQENPYVVNSESGGFYVFNGHHYGAFPELMIKGFAQEHFEQCDNKKALEFSNLVRRTNLKSAAWFSDTTEYKMNFLNGVLDVRTGKFETGPQRDLGFMFTLDFEYDATARAPIFDKFLDEITCGDNELKQMLLEYGGYALSNDDYWEHKALLLVGDGRNGKSTFMKVMKDVAGDAYSAVSMKNLSNEQHLARLEGKLFNISEEGSNLAFKDTDVFKTVSSGGEINIKTVYEKPYDITNRAKILIACNEIPPAMDRSHGFFKRFAVAPFNAVFEGNKRDIRISDKLRAERAGILNMFLDAYKQMKARGALTEAKSSKEALEIYKIGNDTLLQWLREHLSVSEIKTGFTKNSDLYNSYTGFCSVDGVKPDSREKFFLRLAKVVPEAEKRKDRRKLDGKTERVWLGISLGNPEAF